MGVFTSEAAKLDHHLHAAALEELRELPGRVVTPRLAVPEPQAELLRGLQLLEDAHALGPGLCAVIAFVGVVWLQPLELLEAALTQREGCAWHQLELVEVANAWQQRCQPGSLCLSEVYAEHLQFLHLVRKQAQCGRV